MHTIDVLDLSTYLLADDTYKGWGTNADSAQTAAWQEVDKRGWAGLVRLQARKALAHPGAYRGRSAASSPTSRPTSTFRWRTTLMPSTSGPGTSSTKARSTT